MDVSDDLLCLYTARLEERDGEFVFEVPGSELEYGDLEDGGVYRVAVLPQGGSSSDEEGRGRGRRTQRRPNREPPVSEGDVREVTIEGLGDQGDGIARVDRGYVVIVPDTDVGDEVEIEIRELHDNFAMGRVIEGEEEEPSTETF